MSNPYIVELERLRAELELILFNKGKSIPLDSPLSVLIPTVETIGINTTFKSFLSNNQFELIDNDGEITTISNSKLSGSSITKVKLPKLTGTVYNDTFKNCTGLTDAEIATDSTSATFGASAFYGCSALQNFKGGNITFNSTYNFYNCTSLIKAEFDSIVLSDSKQFYSCTALKIVDLGHTSAIANYLLFDASANFKALVIRNTTMCTLAGSNPFTWLATNVEGWKIYVPDALVDDYKVASNWITYADYFAPLSEYDEDEILNS